MSFFILISIIYHIKYITNLYNFVYYYLYFCLDVNRFCYLVFSVFIFINQKCLPMDNFTLLSIAFLSIIAVMILVIICYLWKEGLKKLSDFEKFSGEDYIKIIEAEQFMKLKFGTGSLFL